MVESGDNGSPLHGSAYLAWSAAKQKASARERTRRLRAKRHSQRIAEEEARAQEEQVELTTLKQSAPRARG